MESYCYLDGKIQPLREAGLPVTDLALQRGYGVFEYLRTREGDLFHFEGHLSRLHRSAEAFHLRVPVPDRELRSIAEDLVQKSGHDIPAVRILLTGGDPQEQVGHFQPRLVLLTEGLPTYPAEDYQQGISLLTVKYQREMPLVKSINYAHAVRLEMFQKRQQADALLYFSDQGVTECPRSNFFGFKNSRLITPVNNILFGVTRSLVLKLAQDHFPVEQRPVSFEELAGLNEAFVTSTSKGIMPVTHIDRQPVGNGKVGECTAALRKIFQSYLDDWQAG